ncbi:dienelactone hydrolase family protein [Aquisalimonas lutea]|uniref:dienelactone hydrolase family protein n=1 Tax=Aquisalimonas lutea TaxID=1327750 RepID=UPI0025B41856|nr:dienelactone hydrolase family protein [Aquisalimonas lutea]MDN3516008.1 dienelactone hydrolase family protein [Aquisalimonas lutea]
MPVRFPYLRLVSAGVLMLLACSVAAAQTPFGHPAWQLGGQGETVTFPSGNPAVLDELVADEVEQDQQLAARLYLPQGQGPHPVVVFMPGSGGVRPDADPQQASLLLDAGIGALVVDPFTPRGVEDTISDQTKISWATSVYDAFAAYQFLEEHDAVDGDRIGVIGFSRGGYVAVQAAMRQLADPLLGEDTGFAAAYGAYPWCGAQFRRPEVGDTQVRIAIGDQDNWVSPIKCQAWEQAIGLLNEGQSSLWLVPGAHHAFDRGQVDVQEVPAATKATRFPIWYINGQAEFRDYRDGDYEGSVSDRDRMRQVMESGLAERGASFGSTPELARRFREDMVGFFSETLQ